MGPQGVLGRVPGASLAGGLREVSGGLSESEASPAPSPGSQSPGPPSLPPRARRTDTSGPLLSCSCLFLLVWRHCAFAVGLHPQPGATESAARAHQGRAHVRGSVTLQLFLWIKNHFSVSNYVDRTLLHSRLRGRQRKSDVLPRVTTASERPPGFRAPRAEPPAEPPLGRPLRPLPAQPSPRQGLQGAGLSLGERAPWSFRIQEAGGQLPVS